MSVLEVFNFIILIIVLGVGIYFGYRYYIQNKVKEKIEKEISKTIKKNIKKESADIIPKEWLSNDKAIDLEAFMDNTIESNLSGNELGNFLKGMMNGNSNMFSGIFSQMLTNDSELLRKLSEKFGISPMIAKPILITALSGVSSYANRILTNVLKDKFEKGIKNKKLPGRKSKTTNISSEQSLSLGLGQISF